jgi:hypothetical protein
MVGREVGMMIEINHLETERELSDAIYFKESSLDFDWWGHYIDSGVGGGVLAIFALVP